MKLHGALPVNEMGDYRTGSGSDRMLLNLGPLHEYQLFAKLARPANQRGGIRVATAPGSVVFANNFGRKSL